jgi:hypothetical protein
MVGRTLMWVPRGRCETAFGARVLMTALGREHLNTYSLGCNVADTLSVAVPHVSVNTTEC